MPPYRLLSTRCSLTPANRPSTHSNRHYLLRRHPLTLTHNLLFPLHHILRHTITIFTPFHCLLLPRCPALALPRRSLTPPHCLLTSPFFHLLLIASVTPFDAFSLPFNASSLPFNALRHTWLHFTRPFMPPHCLLTTLQRPLTPTRRP